METFLRLVALALITLGWRFLFDFGWWQSLFLAFLWTALLTGILDVGLYLHRIARHLGITRHADD